ncbi:MAG: bifunctional phosphoribosylaminoimidazolecarboxamide formyltransferase/IMP cyclohydrolase [Planctomycetota bacterium]|jgi:phosphoribosylaminoimidazolecarboxamide formyltransferase/IMP cyclohydrolase
MTRSSTIPAAAADSDLAPIRRALLSVSDKTDLIPLGRALAELGVQIISTGGTATALGEAGIPVTGIEDVTGIPEMMDGRVKTLHPSVHGALLGRRDLETHRAAMESHGIEPIDLVCVNLYPFERTIRGEDVTFDEAIEQIDIGGPAILRSAAKNHQFVTVVTSPTQYDRVINELRAHDGATTLALRRELAAAAFSRTARYDTAISAWMSERGESSFPPLLRRSWAWSRDLRYGENPHQKAALYADPTAEGPGIVTADILHGKPLSYNNILDAAAALQLARELQGVFPHSVAAAVIKHTNPCGAAVADDAATAFRRAYAGDPLAAFGGILAVGRGIDDATAAAIVEGERFLEVVIGQSFTPGAEKALTDRWKNVRLLAVPDLGEALRRALDVRSVPGGLLVQERDLRLAKPSKWAHAAGPEPTDAVLHDAAFAWTVVKHLKSNAVAVARDGELLGGGFGHVDRVGACRLAIEKAGDRLGAAPAVAASDAFFPFPDGPELLVDAGVRCLVHPGGSRRDEETFALCEQHGVTCLVTRIRHFRH